MRPFTELLLFAMELNLLDHDPSAKFDLLLGRHYQGSYHLPEERVLMEVILQGLRSDDERRYVAYSHRIAKETFIDISYVKMTLKCLHGQKIIDLVSATYEEGGYAGRGYVIKDLDIFTASEYKRGLK